MKTYIKYQDAPLPWVAHIPKHWNMIRNAALLNRKQNKVGRAYREYDLLSLTTSGIKVKDIDDVRGKVPTSYEGYQKVLPGDMVFCLFDLDCSAVFSGISNYSGMITSAYDVATPDKMIVNPDYIDYWFRSVFVGRHYKIFSKSVRYTINWDIFKTAKTPVPPRDEQDRIVGFLDWKISKINSLLNNQKKQIRIIEEMKENIICNALLHGVDGNVPHKDSGIQWIGSIPSHWNVIKIKWLFDEAGKRNSREDAELLTFSKKRGLIPFSEASDKMPSASDLSNYKLLHSGQLLENRMQAWHGMFICADKDGCVSPDYSVFNVSKDRAVNVKFYEYAFRSHIWVEQFANASRGIGTGFNRLYTPQFGAIYAVYLEEDEQNRIVVYLDGIMNQLNVLIAKLESRIEILEELKDTLISDVVTGKIDIRDIEIPEYERVEEDLDEDAVAESETGEIEEQED